MRKYLRLSGLVILLFATGLIVSCDKKKDLELLKNKSWKVTELVQSNADSIVFITDEYILTFEDYNGYRFNLDVNTCGGSYTISKNNTISFGEGFCTEACCDSELANNILHIILKADRYRVSGRTLLLETDSVKLALINF